MREKKRNKNLSELCGTVYDLYQLVKVFKATFLLLFLICRLQY